MYVRRTKNRSSSSSPVWSSTIVLVTGFQNTTRQPQCPSSTSERTTVTASAEGIVANFQLTEGTYTQPGIPVATLIDTTRWRLVASVPENWLEKIRLGDKVYYSLRNYPGRLRTATVEYVGRGVVQGQGVPSGNLPDTDPRRIRQTDTPQAGQEFQVVMHLQAAMSPIV